jgi:tetratricopeptide (TPR) repeat protein
MSATLDLKLQQAAAALAVGHLARAGAPSAEVLVRAGKRQDAVASYEHALGLKPDYSEALSGLGAALLESGKAVEATVCFRRAILLAPDSADYHADLGHALLEQQLWDEAAASYQQVLKLRPDCSIARVPACSRKATRWAPCE